MSEKLIKKLPEDGFIYGAVDVKDGEWTVNQLIARENAAAQQFVEKYQTNSMGPGDKTPTREPKPTPAVVKQY